MADGVSVLAYVGLGANLGDPADALRSAQEALAQLPGTRLVRISSRYRTQPVDAGGPDYLNAVAELSTCLPATALLAELHGIEARHGRERLFHNAPRTLDLDLLLYGQASLESPTLTLPHPRMHERAFVLVPLHELRPDLLLPTPHGPRLVGELLAGVVGQGIDKLNP